MAYAFSLKLLKIRKLHICKVVFMYVRVMKLRGSWKERMRSIIVLLVNGSHMHVIE